MKYEFYTGAYGTKETETIHHFLFDTETEKLLPLDAFSGVENPSYVIRHPMLPVLYTVEELTPEGRIAVFSVTDTGLEYIKSIPSCGADPCHLELDESGKYLFTANYTSGTLSVYRLDEDGIPQECTFVLEHKGHGADPMRQAGPHIHFSHYDNGELYLCDLGKDKVYIYAFDPETGTLVKTDKTIKFGAGDGPRHLVLSHIEYEGKKKDVLYVMTELAVSVQVFMRPEGKSKFTKVQELFMYKDVMNRDLLDNAENKSFGAAIKMSDDGKLVFASERGRHRISAFHVTEEGYLMLGPVNASTVNTPRDFTIFGSYMIAAGQNSNDLAVLRIDKDGKLEQAGEHVAIPSPVCVYRCK